MAVSTKTELLKFLNENKSLLSERYGVSQIGIFGSFAKERQDASSDIDLVVQIRKEKKNIHTYMQLKRYLEKKLERKVDLGFEHTLRPVIKEKIEKELIYVK